MLVEIGTGCGGIVHVVWRGPSSLSSGRLHWPVFSSRKSRSVLGKLLAVPIVHGEYGIRW